MSFGLLVISWPTFGQAADLSGRLTQDLVLGPEMGPVTILQDVLVDKGTTLTLMPGTVLRIRPSSGGKEGNYETSNTDLSILGTLIAVGTDDKPIVIETAGAYQWGAIYLSKGSDKSRLKHCNIRGGRIIINGASPSIVHCNIFEGGGIEIAHQARPTIRGNNLYYNSIGLRSWARSSGGVIKDNNITRNGYGIYIDDFDATSLLIEDNNIYSNKTYNLAHVSPQNIMVTKNYWGSRDYMTISNTILDRRSSPASGKVSYRPFRVSEQTMTWALEVDMRLPPGPTIEALIYQKPEGRLRPPIGFFQSADRKFGFYIMPAIVIPQFDSILFDYESNFLFGGEFRLVYDDSKTMGIEVFSTSMTSKPGGLLADEEESTFTWLSIGLRGEWRPLAGKALSPLLSIGAGLNGVTVKSTYFLSPADKTNIQNSKTSQWNMGFSFGTGISYFINRMVETQIGMRYFLLQKDDGLGLGQDSIQFLSIGISLVKYI